MITGQENFKWYKYATKDKWGFPTGIKEDAPDWAKENYRKYKKEEQRNKAENED